MHTSGFFFKLASFYVSYVDVLCHGRLSVSPVEDGARELEDELVRLKPEISVT